LERGRKGEREKRRMGERDNTKEHKGKKFPLPDLPPRGKEKLTSRFCGIRKGVYYKNINALKSNLKFNKY
jgi:hypothetical protein